jgi:hypothetical protein
MHSTCFNNRFLFIATIALLFTLVSCEKEVHINMSSTAPRLVVQGAIETGVYPYVFLTSTIGFFEKVDLSTLEKSFIHGADVKVSNGSKTITLREYSFDTGSSSKFYLYSIDTADLANAFVGEEGKSYTLTITYDGKTYTSVTKVPAAKNIDSMWFNIPLFKNSKTPDSARQLFVNFTDPDTPGNYIRYYTSKNYEQFIASDQFNDEVVNGKPLTEIPLYAGFETTDNNDNEDSLRYFYPGDTVILKWSSIDKRVYNFWNSFAYAQNSLGNPFASPINLQTNMSNGALGIWGGYGSVYDTLVVPHK